jgi:hypothetical protein
MEDISYEKKSLKLFSSKNTNWKELFRLLSLQNKHNP